MGAVINVLQPNPGTGFAVFGAGAVGLSALMAARIAGCDPIVAVDRVPARLELAAELGATVTIRAGHEDAVARIRALGGVDYAVEAAGIGSVVIDAIRSTKPLGVCLTLGVYRPGATTPIDFSETRNGRKIISVTVGDADPQKFIPHLVDLYMSGQIPLEKLATFFDFDAINRAAESSEDGSAIKPILLMTEP
jgi:aryl-alcohol dehydrogenase